MALDNCNPGKVVNFRDVGEFVNLIAGRDLLPEGRLYRGGPADADGGRVREMLNQTFGGLELEIRVCVWK